MQWTKLTELGQTQVLPLVGATFTVNREGLFFASVVREDSGWYTGSIENVLGRAQCKSRLQVAGEGVCGGYVGGHVMMCGEHV